MSDGANKETDLLLVGEAVEWIRGCRWIDKPGVSYAPEIERLMEKSRSFGVARPVPTVR